ncbi:MAG TPA: hypothetical protein VIP98_05510 [Microlunatus sp.]
MAIIHQAELTPSKPELIMAWLDREPWGGTGEIEIIGSYRYDDPDGEVGVEAFLVRRGDRLLHLPLTYRGAPLDGAEDRLISTMTHSVLGDRWVYDATADPVAVACYRRALCGQQEQAEMEVVEGDRVVRRRDSAIRIRRTTSAGEESVDRTGSAAGGAASEAAPAATVRVVRVVEATSDLRHAAVPRLVAQWGDRAEPVVVATLG